MFIFDPTYLIFIIPGVLLALFAQLLVASSTFS
jgi:hypothetical protein